MSKAALDSDLYGDIYGDDEDALLTTKVETSADDEFQFQDPEGFEQLTTADASSTSTTTVSNEDEKKPQAATPNKSTDASSQSSTPKDTDGENGSVQTGNQNQNGNGLSYSAQIAQQFSAYQQTPSQERQQRNVSGSSGANGITSANGTAPIATLESSGGTVFGMKPSEMHDHG
ncbi:hypothetical protein VNI00_005458 [Paramarasmius palmivorus]|uniref:Uncharacterized protein n=1 Tax=Paramarasmius palmivorus TaxID=297713 RepID=A0AAW0DFE9_9AGAR